jgi:hypothetical protein
MLTNSLAGKPPGEWSWIDMKASLHYERPNRNAGLPGQTIPQILSFLTFVLSVSLW